MGIIEEILDEFFEKLEGDKKFPNAVARELKKLWKSGEIASQEKILDAIRGGSANVSKN